MKKLLIISITLVTTFQLSAMSGRQIMQKNDALPEAKSAKGSSLLVIMKGGRKIVKAFRTESKKYGERTRSRITFTRPTRIEFLTHSQPGSDSNQWIKLTSGKVRKIASSDKGNAFVNSHFYYEDIGDRDIDDYNYKNIGEGSVDSQAVYKVQAVKKTGTKVYSKTVMYVRKSDYVVVQVDFYENGRHTKTLKNKNITKIQGIYTPRKVYMMRKDGSGGSLLQLKSIKYNVPVSDSRLKPAGL